MTEGEWMVCTDPSAMLDAIGATKSPRKFRLLVCEVVSATMLSNPSPLHQYVSTTGANVDCDRMSRTVAENVIANLARFANGEISSKRMQRLTKCFPTHSGPFTSEAADVIRAIISSILDRRRHGDGLRTWLRAQPTPIPLPRVADLFREVFGNPFRPVVLDPRWRTSDVLGLVLAIYEDRVFDRLPILADALMDAGCDNDDILDHCRSDGPHVRGCWVVDLVLGKE